MEQTIKKYIQHLKDLNNRKHPSEDEIWAELEVEINQQNKFSKKNNKLIYFLTSGIAASIIGALFLSSMLFRDTKKDNSPVLTNGNSETEYIKLISSSGKDIELINDKITYTHQVEKKESINIGDQSLTETLVTPKGRICKLVLSDGSIVHINANSSVTYPKVFSQEERRIKVEGEVFCEVEKSDQIPFYVETKDFTVKVLGTKFNVSAYKNKEKSNVILVSGEVHLSGKGADPKLKPRQMALFDNEAFVSLRNVETSRYTSWVDGYLILKSEPLRDIFQKLEQFYGVNIVCDSMMENEQYTGKLDLSNNINEILEMIQFTMPLKFQKDGELYTISQK